MKSKERWDEMGWELKLNTSFRDWFTGLFAITGCLCLLGGVFFSEKLHGTHAARLRWSLESRPRPHLVEATLSSATLRTPLDCTELRRLFHGPSFLCFDLLLIGTLGHKKARFSETQNIRSLRGEKPLGAWPNHPCASVQSLPHTFEFLSCNA